MKGYGALAFAIGLACAGIGPARAWADNAPATSTTSTTSNNTGGDADMRSRFFRQRLASAHAMAREENYRNADQAFAEVFADPMFALLSDSEQRTALSTAGWMAVKLDKTERARDLYRLATSYADSDPDDWYRLSYLEYDLDRVEEAATAFTEVIERWPQLLPNVDESHIHRLRNSLDFDSPVRLKLLQALFDANWKTTGGGDSAAWYSLAVARAERGDMDGVRAAVRRIDDPLDLVRLRSDMRFDAAIDADASAFDPLLAAQRRVEELHQQTGLQPDNLELRMQLTYALLTVGMHEEAVALADRSLAAVAEAPVDAPAFKDIEEQVWVMNNRAMALRRLGRDDEALAEMVRASQLTEDGGVNVSQALNLGTLYCSLDRPVDALQAIDKAGDAISGFGRMVENNVRLCAARQSGRTRDARRALAYLRDHRDDGQAVYLEALLRAGELDEAAGQVMRQLASPEDRGGMLEWLQGYLLPEPLPGDVDARAAREALLAREDVQAAVAKVGRIGRYAIYGDNTSF